VIRCRLTAEFRIIYVGIDIDDTVFHGAGLNMSKGEFIEFRCKPDKGVLREKVQNLLTPIYIPEESDEEIRDVLPSRNSLVRQRKRLKTNILVGKNIM